MKKNVKQKTGMHLIKAPLAVAKATLCIDAVHLFVRSFVGKICTRFFQKKTKQFRAMVSIDDL